MPSQANVAVIDATDLEAKISRLEDSECVEGCPVERHAESDHAMEPASDAADEKGGAARVFKMSTTVRCGGAILALCAGMVNAISFHALGAFVSHMTGSASKISLGLQDAGLFDPSVSLFLVLSFVLGAALTGFLIAKDTIHFGMALYDLCLLSEAGLLIAITFCHEEEIAKYLAAAACGLQNGMATHWGGAVVRTTHFTGLLTDVGLSVGRLTSLFCRKRCGATFDNFDRAFVADDVSKLSVLATIFVAFLAGVFGGAHLFNSLKHLAFLVPACITGVIGITYSMYRVFVLGQSFFSDAEMEAIDITATVEAEIKDIQDQESIGGRDRAPSDHSDKSECSAKASRRSSRSDISSNKGDVVCITRKTASKHAARISPA